MNRTALSAETDLPQAKLRRRKWSFSAIWVVPIVAALVAGYLVYQRVRQFGPGITISFPDATGINPGQTVIQYRGAEIGRVMSVALSGDEQSAVVQAKLHRDAAVIARQGSVFWIVRPKVGMGNLTALGTIITGPYIAVAPGSGKPAANFIGVENSPQVIDPQGLQVVLLANQGGSLHAGIPIYYRGIEVGMVSETRLGSDATTVEVHCVIRHRYAPLVRTGSKFWDASGLQAHVGLLSGANINVESLKSLLIGGIAFATPDDTNAPSPPAGTAFRLYKEPEDAWLAWRPVIHIFPADAGADTDAADTEINPKANLRLLPGGSP